MSPTYKAVQKADIFSKFVDKLIKDNVPFGFDIESGYVGEDKEGVALLTEHPDWVMVGFSFTNSDTWAAYVPVRHDDESVNIDDVQETARLFWKLLRTGLGVAHHAQFELQALSRWFLETLPDDEEVQKEKGFFPLFSDSMVEAHESALYAPKSKSGPGNGLKELVFHVFGHKMTEFLALFPEATTPKARKSVRFNTRQLTNEVVEYACEDSLWCLKLHKKHYPILMNRKIPQIFEGFEGIHQTEIDLIPVMVSMEKFGVCMDWDLIEAKLKEVEEFQILYNEELHAEIAEVTGIQNSYNFGSSKQMQELLFKVLGITPKAFTDKGAPSTSAKALQAVAREEPIVRKILEYREIVKLKTSYLQKYLKDLRYSPTGKVYPNHNQVGTITGRLSVDRFSYQQLPKPYHYELKSGRTFDMNFRDLIISPEDYRIVGYDFSQVELRVLAGYSQEHHMIDAFNSGEDYHKATAAKMMGIPISAVTKSIRAIGKTLGFATVYGSGPGNIAEMLTTPEKPVTKEDAQKLLDQYFEALPALDVWMRAQREFGHAHQYVETPFGRQVHVWEFQDSRNFIRQEGERLCTNAPIQGGAGDYMKIGMVRAYRALKDAGLLDKIIMVMTVHDALEFYVHKSISSQQVIDIIQPAVSFDLPGYPEILAEWHEGDKLGQLIELSLDENKKIKSYGIDGVDMEFDSIADAEMYKVHPEKFVKPEKVENVPEDISRVIVYTFPGMPGREAWGKFKELIQTLPEGQSNISIDTVKGFVPDIVKNKSITSDQAKQFSELFGGIKYEFVGA